MKKHSQTFFKMVSELKCGECRCIAIKSCEECESYLCLRHKECPFCAKEKKRRDKKWLLYRSHYPVSFIYFNLKWWMELIIGLILISFGVSLFSTYSHEHASLMSLGFWIPMYLAFKRTLIEFETYLVITQDGSR